MFEALTVDGVVQLAAGTAIGIAAMLIGFAAGGLPGVGSLAAPVLTLALPFEVAQTLVVPMFLFAQIAGTAVHWKHICWRELRFVVICSACGIAIGWMIWELMLDTPQFPMFRLYLKFATACLIAGLANNLYRTRIQMPAMVTSAPGVRASILWCLLAGVLSTLANVSGSLIVWLLNQRDLSKEQLTSTVAASYVLINSLKLIPYTALGFYSASDIGAHQLRDIIAWLAVLALISTAILLGRWRLRKTTERRFSLALITAMAIVTAGIIWQTVPRMAATPLASEVRAADA